MTPIAVNLQTIKPITAYFLTPPTLFTFEAFCYIILLFNQQTEIIVNYLQTKGFPSLALILKYPKRQSIAFSTKLFNLYKSALRSDEDEIIFDLSNNESLSPFGVVMLTITIHACAREGRTRRYVAPKSPTHKRFLTTIGFNDYFHLSSASNERDLIKTETVQLRACDGVDYQIIERLIYLFSDHLNLSRGIKESLQMSLQEIMTNVVDHSGRSKYLICAYADRANKKIRLCIADSGMGILKSLRNSGSYDYISDDYEAIKEATIDGVTL